MTKPLSVCIPTLKRYQMLYDLIDSLRKGSWLPTDIYVIDNGSGFFQGDSAEFVDEWGIHHHYRKYGGNIGCAASWNKFIEQTTDMRVICNDDIEFKHDTLERLMNAFNPQRVISPISVVGGNAFSCFVLPDYLVQRVGLFDETISPNYAYWEDVDYSRRLTLAGYGIEGVEGCEVNHFGSATVKSFNDQEWVEHHDRFNTAQNNYVRKWHGMPGQEEWTTPYNGAR